MCHYVDEASSRDLSEWRRRSETADDPSADSHDSTEPLKKTVDDPDGEESEPPAEPRAPADD